ncbi:MAG: serine/threonine-protein kinase [Candidatus Obscuribacterales bacterium]
MKDPQHELRDADALELAGEEPAFLGVVLEGKYELQSQLGRGGMGVVYKAWHRLLDRPVAVKMLHAHLVADEQQLLQMRREARLIADLDHPNIVSVQAFGTTPEGAPYVVMELLEGRTLAEILESEKQLSIERTVDLVLQVATALQYSHEKGIIHRDLKPNNIVVCPGENGAGESVKIVDFGIARRDVQSHTVTQVVGTPPYMSPEQCMGKRGTAQADLYSLACVMHECVSGQPPFVGESAIDTLRMHLSAEPPPLKTLRKETPVALQNITLKLLAKDPQARYESAAELLEDLSALKKFLAGGGSEPVVFVPSASLAQKRRRVPKRGLLLGVAGVVSLCCLGLLAQYFFLSRATHDDAVRGAEPQLNDKAEDPKMDVQARLRIYCQRLGAVSGETAGSLPKHFEEALLELRNPGTQTPRQLSPKFIKMATSYEMLAAEYFLLSNNASRAAYHADLAARYSHYKEPADRSSSYVEAMCLFAKACLSAGNANKAMEALDLAEGVLPSSRPENSQAYHDYNRITPVRMQSYWQLKQFDKALEMADVTAQAVIPSHDAEHQASKLEAMCRLDEANGGNFKDAIQLGTKLLDPETGTDWREDQAKKLACRMLAKALLANGEVTEAEDRLQLGIKAARKNRLMFYEEQKCRLDLADLLIQQKRYREAIDLLQATVLLQRELPSLCEWRSGHSEVDVGGFALPSDDVRVEDLMLTALVKLKAAYEAEHSDGFKPFQEEYETRLAANSRSHEKGMPAKLFALPKLPAEESHAD